MQLDNLSGQGIPHGLCGGIHESKQLKSIVVNLQQESGCNQVKLISATCCGEVEVLAGTHHDTKVLSRDFNLEYTGLIKHRGIWHSTDKYW